MPNDHYLTAYGCTYGPDCKQCDESVARAASQERPSIDVERLARALKAVRRQQDNAEGRRKGYSDNYFDPEAEAIAAEYLRLSGPVGEHCCPPHESEDCRDQCDGMCPCC